MMVIIQDTTARHNPRLCKNRVPVVPDEMLINPSEPNVGFCSADIGSLVVWNIFYVSTQLGIIIPTDFHIFQDC